MHHACALQDGIANTPKETHRCPASQIWAGSKQRELKASSMQLLYSYTPQVGMELVTVELPYFCAAQGGRVARVPATLLYN